tara:strand:+ start:1294 stop:1431 length:138 start_codon:yes stop_codon:yes gene_type:complete
MTFGWLLKIDLHRDGCVKNDRKCAFITPKSCFSFIVALSVNRQLK